MADERPLVLVTTSTTDRNPDYWARAFNRPLHAAGALPMLFPVTEGAQARREALAYADGLVLGGGWDIEPERFGAEPSDLLWQLDPVRDELELGLVVEALAAGVPMLGTCRGMQVINVARGGSLHLDASLHPGAEDHPSGGHEGFAPIVAAEAEDRDPDRAEIVGHPITVDPGSALAPVLGSRPHVNSFHHQHLDRLGEGVVATGHSDDGVVELIEVDGSPAPAIGVQWEAQTGWRTDPAVLGVFEFLVEAARSRRRS
jgi:putative glutamine amidotransferase